MTSSIQQFADELSTRLARPLPGRRAQARFAPELSYGRHAGPPLSTARPAAVVALLYQQDGQWRVPMTLRPQNLPDHAGQVCFPGGVTESDESSEQSALRELDEELGVAAEHVRLLGRLSPVYVFGTNYWVTPFVGISEASLVFAPNPHEVAEVVDVHVAMLLDPANYGSHPIRRRGVVFHAPHIAIGRHRIWGATSMMLGELIDVLNDVGATGILA